jgi:hypothetical protein
VLVKILEIYSSRFYIDMDDCSSGVGAYSQYTSDFPELKEGERYGACEERSVGLVCNIEN